MLLQLVTSICNLFGNRLRAGSVFYSCVLFFASFFGSLFLISSLVFLLYYDRNMVSVKDLIPFVWNIVFAFGYFDGQWS